MLDVPGSIPDEYQPNWTLLMVIFIVSTAIAAIVGVVSLLKTPIIPDLPEFQEPNSDWMKSYTTFGDQVWQENPPSSYPLPTHDDTYPMETLQMKPAYDIQNWGQLQQRARPSEQPPVTVMTQKM